MLLQFLRAQESGDPYAFRFEPQDYILPTAGGDSPSARFDWTQEVLADLQAVRRPGRDPSVVQRMGEKLHRFVKQAGWENYEREIAQALAAQRRVVLTIRSSAAELYALPWELLTLKNGQFIGEVQGLLLRFEWPESKTVDEHPRPRPEGGRILFAWSASGGAVPVLEHTRAIEAACAAGYHPFSRDTDVLAHATLGQIAKSLEEAQQSGKPIAVLHLLCHGGSTGSTFGLSLDGDDGSVVVDPIRLRQRLAPFASMVRLVVLAVCDSGNAGAFGNQLGSVAQSLHRCGFQSVIASRYPLSVAGSIQLTESLYGELLQGPASVETAFLAARKCLVRNESDRSREQERFDWASVQLYARHEDGDDTRPFVFRPFRGLLAFERAHSRFFFGRDIEVQELLTDLKALSDQKKERFLVVAGASGTGKSSLVFAGAAPKLLSAQPQLRFLSMRPGSDPCQALDEVLATCPAGAPALLVVDQFEEIFTQTEAPEVRDAFVRRLWSLSSTPDPGLSVVITLRVDFIGRCGELVVNTDGVRLDSIAYAEAHRVFVAQLGPQQLRAAIVEPARKVGLELQAGLVDRIIHEVSGEPGALPLLEDALDVLWQHRSDRWLTQAAYDALGGVVGALQKKADAILTKWPPADRSVAQRLLVNLVAVADDTALDTRLRVPLVDLKRSIATADAAGFNRVLDDMVLARLLVQAGDGRASTVEVAHEALIRRWPQLCGWLDEDRAGLLVQRRVKQATQQWERQNRDESLLYRGTQLVQATEWRKTWESRFGDAERSFLDASAALRVRQDTEAAERQRRESDAAERLAEEKREKEKQKLEAAQKLARRTRLAAVVLGMFFALAAVASVQAYRQSAIATEKSTEAIQKSIEADRERIKAELKAVEAHDSLLIAVAQTRKDDPTLVATILREARHPDSMLWVQSALDALQTGIAEHVLRGHKSSIDSVGFSPDGLKIITGSSDDTVRIWNADGFGAPVVLEGDSFPGILAAFSRDGTKIIIGSSNGIVRIWNHDGSGPPVVFAGWKYARDVVGYSPDGQKIVLSTKDHTAIVCNVDGSNGQVALKGHESDIYAIGFSPDGTKIVTGSYDNTARVWSADGSGTPVVLKGHEGGITSIGFSPDGKKVVTGSRDNTARIWNIDGSGAPVVLSGHSQAVTSVSFSPDGKKVATGSRDKTARIWNAESFDVPTWHGLRHRIEVGSFVIILRGHEDAVNSVAFRPDGRKVITVSQDGTARIWNAAGSGFPLMLDGHAPAESAAFSADGKTIVSRAWDGTCDIWNADGTGALVLPKPLESAIRVVVINSDGGNADSGSLGTTRRFWNADRSAAVVLAGDPEFHAVAFSPDGSKIATGSRDLSVRLWNTDGSAAGVLTGHTSRISQVVFSDDGKKLVASSADGTARVWNADGSGTAVVLKGHEFEVTAVAFSPDGKHIATGSQDKTARIWNADGSGTPLVLQGHSQRVSLVAFSPDGRKVATGSWDETLRIWNTDGSGAPIVLTGELGSCNSIAFSPDGGKIVTLGARDNRVRVWTVSGSALLGALWQATTDCLPEARRHDLFVESSREASEGHADCQKQVARRAGWSARLVHQ